MTYQNDPKRDFDRPIDAVDRRIEKREGWGTGSVILASLAALAVVFGLFYAMSNRGDTSMANRDANRPTVTTTTPATNPPARETTGSGAVNRTQDSTGTKPAMPAQVPAPTSPPATNR